jgi:hypothetical protein
VVDYKGKTFLFYHNGALPGGGGFKRSVCVDEMNFRADGSVQRVEPTDGLTRGVDNLNPFANIEAATIAFEEGIETDTDSLTRNVYVTAISNGDYIKVRQVDFGKGGQSFEARVASVTEDGSIEIRIDSSTGTLLGTCTIKNTGGLQKWATASCKIEKITGIHDIYFVFKGGEGNLFNFDWWRFVK